jgi:hypothetical protein
MPELLEGLEELARQRGSSLERASRELTEEPEGFLIVAREACGFVELLSYFWEVIKRRLRKGGVPAKELLQRCDTLLKMHDPPAEYLSRVIAAWHEKTLPPEMAEETYADVLSARERLDALTEDVRKARAGAAAPPRISADLEEVKRRIKQTDDGGGWVNLSRQRGSPDKE